MISGEDIKVARIRNGHMTQSELATRLGVSLRTVTGWETGATIPPKQQAALADVLGVGGIAPQVRDFVDPLSELSDAQLIAELARRLAYVRNEAALASHSHGTATGSDAKWGLQDQQSRPVGAGSQVGNDAGGGSVAPETTRKMTESHVSGDGVTGAVPLGGSSDPFADEVVGSFEKRGEVQPVSRNQKGRRNRGAV